MLRAHVRSGGTLALPTPAAPAAPAVFLETPPLPRIVPADVFDAFGWCDSERLEWRRPADGGSSGRGARAWDESTPIDGADPARMVFVMRAECTFLPRELARLHAFGLGLEDEWALAPYAIDDATDELHARGVRPADLLWLAADNLNALFWGLHDWAHFHNHGAFEPHQRALTEVQCDAAALSWTHRNRRAIGVSPARWVRMKEEVLALSASRLASDGVRFDLDVVRALVE